MNEIMIKMKETCVLVTGDVIIWACMHNGQSVAPAITLDDPSDTSSGIEFSLFLTKFN